MRGCGRPNRAAKTVSGVARRKACAGLIGYERLAELVPNLPDTRLVYVADREADMMPLMARAQALACPVDWLVRAAHNRCLPGSDKQHLWARRVELPAGKNKTVSVTCIVAREYGGQPASSRSNGAC
jgi:hypothetical protein